MKSRIALSALSFLISTSAALSSAEAATHTMVDCLSKTGTSDIRIGLKDVKTTEYAYVYDGVRGYNTEMSKGTAEVYNSEKLLFTAKVSSKSLTLEIDFLSTEVANGTLTIDGKTQKVECYSSDVKVEE